jgi:hypothetical protein
MPPDTARYDTDFYTWTQHQAALLREGAVAELDLANLAEEIERLGKRDRRALRSHLAGLVMHLLKWQYQPAGREPHLGWYRSIVEHRGQAVGILEESPSLRRVVPALLAQGYGSARMVASHETHLPLDLFPVTCPWSVEQALRDDFWPEADLP